MQNLHVGLDSYDAYESYINLQIAKELEKELLPHIFRGNFVLNTKIKATSEVFLKEIMDWLGEQRYGVITLCVEQFSFASASILAKKFSEDALLYLVIRADNMNYDIYARKFEEATRFNQILEEKFKSPKKSVGGDINFAFWQQDDDSGCEVTTSNKQCPSLEEISINYSPKIVKKIEEILALKNPYDHGKIILYHGEAGNGKTFLLRSLARAWNETHGIIPEVIIDPEALYENPKYLTNLLLNGTDRIYPSKTEPPFRLIIAEDCAQIFGVDSRNQTGFSRLLNTVDGLLGQGQKLVFIFTANEKISEIDQAILRPGRCLQNLEISNWSQAAAIKWLKDKGVEKPNISNEVSLAEMYAILNKTMHADQQRSTLGF